MEEKKESRVNIEELPRVEQELTNEEAKEVKGGAATLLPAIQKATETTSSNIGPFREVSGFKSESEVVE